MKNIILTIVKARNAVKSVDLALAVIDVTMPKMFEIEEYHQAMTELLKEGEITELEYLEPDHGFMMKRALYFAKGVVIVTKGLNEPRASDVEVKLARESERDV